MMKVFLGGDWFRHNSVGPGSTLLWTGVQIPTPPPLQQQKKKKMSKQKTEGGQGGKKGHSNMVHYDYTEVVKAEAKHRRRQEDKKVIKEHLKDFE